MALTVWEQFLHQVYEIPKMELTLLERKLAEIEVPKDEPHREFYLKLVSYSRPNHYDVKK